MKYIPNLSKEELQLIVKSCLNYSDVMRALGYKHTNHQDTLRKYIKLYNIDVSHFTKKFAEKDFPEIYSNDEIFRKNSAWRSNTSSLKKRILKYNLLEYKCSLCGNEGYWNNKPLVLQLDHIDGDRTNNEITNLRFLCPNCHTQTDTYANKRGSYHKKKN